MLLHGNILMYYNTKIGTNQAYKAKMAGKLSESRSIWNRFFQFPDIRFPFFQFPDFEKTFFKFPDFVLKQKKFFSSDQKTLQTLKEYPPWLTVGDKQDGPLISTYASLFNVRTSDVSGEMISTKIFFLKDFRPDRPLKILVSVVVE